MDDIYIHRAQKDSVEIHHIGGESLMIVCSWLYVANMVID